MVFLLFSGCLDPSHVRAEMSEFGVGTGNAICGGRLNIDDFKSLAVIWLRKILDSHAGEATRGSHTRGVSLEPGNPETHSSSGAEALPFLLQGSELCCLS